MPSIDPLYPNLTYVKCGEFAYWFSYRTCVSFQKQGYPRVVIQNYWSTTTDKHLNIIDGGKEEKKNRVTYEEFLRLYKEQGGTD